jgi:hypothetical protein
MSVDPMSAKPQSALLKCDVTFELGVNLLPRHFYGELLAKLDQPTADYLATTQEALRSAALQFTVSPLLTAFATAIMIFWYLESIGEAFCFCFVDFSTVMESEIFTQFLARAFPTDKRDFLLFSPLRKALTSFASQVVFQRVPNPAEVRIHGCQTPNQARNNNKRSIWSSRVA